MSAHVLAGCADRAAADVVVTDAPVAVAPGMPSSPSLLEGVRRRVLARTADVPVAHLAAPGALRAHLAAALAQEAPLLSGAAFADALAELDAELCGLGPLEVLLADPEVTEVVVNGSTGTYVERRGRLEPVALRFDHATLVRIAERVVAPLGLRLDPASPMVDARLPDGSRFHAVVPPVALDGPCLTIRRFGAAPVPLHAFGPPHVVEPVVELVRARANVLLVGATGSGKTTLLNALSAELPASERVVTIEETAELRLAHPHVVRLEARPPNAEGRGEITVRQLVRTALRMRPDRIVIGEVRGGEALDLLLALHTGHEGSLCTVHAHGADDALRRLEALALQAPGAPGTAAVERLVASGIDAVVRVARGPRGTRGILGVHVVDGTEVPARTRLADRAGVALGRRDG
jgi:pilus assembly protein CpaF